MIRNLVAATALLLAPATAMAQAQNVFLGGYVGFQNMSQYGTAGFMATGRGGIYLHGSAVSSSTAAADRAVLRALDPHDVGIFEAGENTFFNRGDAYDSFLAASGWKPQYITLNIGSTDSFKAPQLAAFKQWVNQVRTRFPGIRVGPFMTPGGNDDATNPMSSRFNHPFDVMDPFWGPAAQACAYGGGIAIDVPAHNFLVVPNWATFLEQQIRWANASTIPSVVVFSPANKATFMEDVQAVVARLVHDGAVPAAYAVENYGNGVETISATESTPESLNAVALWLAKNAPVHQF